MYRSITPLLLALGLMTILAPGCTSGTKVGGGEPTGSRQPSSDRVTFTVATAPADWSNVERGAFVIEGIVSADLGLDPQNPKTLTLQVTEIMAGFSEELQIPIGTPMPTPLGIDPTTGHFRLEFTDEYRIWEGYQRLTLIAQDAQENEQTWERYVIATPRFDGWSEQAEANARRSYGLRMLPLFSRYREFMEAAIAIGVDEEAFPHLEYDLTLARHLNECYLDAYIVHADMSSWRDIGEQFESRVDELNEIGAPLSVQEQDYRQHIRIGATSNKAVLGIPYGGRNSYQICEYCGGNGLEATDLDKWDLAFYRHTFPTASWEEVEGGLRYSAEIRVDVGTLPSGCCDGSPPPFVEPLEGTAATNPAVFTLIATILDTNEDDRLDELTFDGTIEGLPYSQEIPADYLQSWGHLATPLQALRYSDYFKP